MKNVLMGYALIIMASSLQADTLTILNWEAFLSEDLISAWEKRSGHTIKQVYYDSEEERDSLISSEARTDIDLVVLDEQSARLLSKAGSKLVPVNTLPGTPNFKHIEEDKADHCGSHGLPYMWGTFGLVYRTDKLTSAPTSWSYILEPSEEVKGHIGLIDDYTDSLAPALIFLGHSINTEDKAQLQSAFELMRGMVEHVLTYEYSLSFVEDDAQADQLYVALGYNSDHQALNEKAGKDVWQYTTLQEGTVIWMDCIAVLSSSRNQQIAADFLHFIYEPSNAAKNAEDIHSASPVKGVKEFQSKEFLADQTVYPPEAILQKAHRYVPLSAQNILLRNRINSSLIRIHESQ